MLEAILLQARVKHLSFNFRVFVRISRSQRNSRFTGLEDFDFDFIKNVILSNRNYMISNPNRLGLGPTANLEVFFFFQHDN